MHYYVAAKFYHYNVIILYQRQLVDLLSQCLVHMQITVRVENNSKMRTRMTIERDNRDGISAVIE